MSADLRSMNLENISDVIRLLNESSRGTSLEYHLDFFGFLSLARYWNFSYKHSLIRYVDDEPAALILTCADSEAHDAFTFYWGTLPKFRSRRISLDLFEACCKKLYENGYTMLYGVSVPERSVRRYRFIQASPQHELIDMQALSATLPAAEPDLEVRSLDVDILSQIELPPGETLHWSQRPAFLRNLSRFLQVLGAFAGDALKAYAVIHPQPASTTLLDLRSPDSCVAAGNELLRWLFTQNYSPPFAATHVFRQSYTHRLLTAAGFAVKRRFVTLFRDLRTTC